MYVDSVPAKVNVKLYLKVDLVTIQFLWPQLLGVNLTFAYIEFFHWAREVIPQIPQFCILTLMVSGVRLVSTAISAVASRDPMQWC